MKRRLTWPKATFSALAALLIAAWYVPKISATRFREPIRSALESALGRKVEMGEVQFRLLPVPGFTIDHVVIGEDPAIGPEPVAYVDTLRARPRLTALFGGPLEFASVDLEDTSVNLTRVGNERTGIHWNFSSLMRPRLLAAFPSIHMVGGRVNFKFEDAKSIFYLLNTDVDLWPPSRSDGPWTLRVRAEPARTDRPARGFGSFVGRGEWRQRDSTLTLDLKMEKSELGDMITLVRGSESPVHGHIWGDAHLAGPLSRLGLAGRLTIDDIHGWNQNPPPGATAWPLSIGGFLNLPGQVVELRALAAGRRSPFDLRYRVSGYLGHPNWGTTAIFTQMPLAPVAGIGRSLGWPIPQDLGVDGTAQGAVSYSMPDGIAQMEGAVRITNATVSVSGAPALRMAAADLQFAGSSATLRPSEIANPANETAMLEASYDLPSGQGSGSITTTGMSIASSRRITGVLKTPLISQATSGLWSGHLGYARGAWLGAFQLTDADVPFEAFNQPLHVISADAEVDNGSVSMKRLNLTIGGMSVTGEYRYEPAAPRPHQFRLNLPRADAGSLEKLLMPALHRGTFLNYAFNFGRVPEPGWMRAMHADGTIQVGTFELAGTNYSRLKGRILWDADEFRIAGLQAQVQSVVLNGSARADLAQREPRYQVSGKFTGLPWKSGTMEGEGTLNTSGTGEDVLSNLTAQGGFKGRNIDLSDQEGWATVNGCFDWSWNTRRARLKLSQLVLTSRGDTWLGDAETQDDGKLRLNVSDGTRQIRTGLNLLGP